MLNISSLARLEVPEKFLWLVVVGGVCKFIFMSNPTVVLRLGWGFDNFVIFFLNLHFGSSSILAVIATF